jgi:hypothetical protein
MLKKKRKKKSADCAGEATKEMHEKVQLLALHWLETARMHAGDEKGNLFIFDPTYSPQTAPMNKDGTRAPSAILSSFHKDTVHSICFAPGPDPSDPKPRIITVSACNRVGVWDINAEKSAWGAAQLIQKVKTKDIIITGACALISGIYAPGMIGVLLSTNTAEVCCRSCGLKLFEKRPTQCGSRCFRSACGKCNSVLLSAL